MARAWVSIQRPPLQFVDVSTRAWKSFDTDCFRDDLLRSPLCCPPNNYSDISVDELQQLYDTTLSDLLDKHAPQRTVRRRHQPMTPWFDADCSAARRRTRAFERRYRRSKLVSDRAAWIAQVRSLHQLYARKQNSYWMAKVADAGGDSKKLWSTLDAVLCKDRSRSRLPTDGLSANDFLNAFSSKVEAVRSSTASAPAPTYTVGSSCSSVLDAFDAIDASYVQKLVLSAPNKNCALDPAPT